MSYLLCYADFLGLLLAKIYGLRWFRFEHLMLLDVCHICEWNNFVFIFDNILYDSFKGSNRAKELQKLLS